MPRGINLVDEATIQGRLWSPALDRTAVWYDAADISTVSIATGVSEWRDKSGNKRHLAQSSSALQPVFLPTGLNGLPTLRSTSTMYDDATWMMTPTLSGFAGTQNLWALAVATMNSATLSFGRLVSFWVQGKTDYDNLPSVALFHRAGLNNAMQTARNNFLLPAAEASIPLSTPFLIGNVFNSGGNVFRVNGIALASNNANAIGNFTTTPIISIFIWQGTPWNGNLSELIIGDTAISPQMMVNYFGYLAWKWGLRDRLGSAHLFANRPPLVGD